MSLRFMFKQRDELEAAVFKNESVILYHALYVNNKQPQLKLKIDSLKNNYSSTMKLATAINKLTDKNIVKTKEYPVIKAIEGENYIVPKIMYIPAERNFLSTISDAYNVKGLPDNLFTFAEELKRAQKELNGKKLQLPITDYIYEYDESEECDQPHQYQHHHLCRQNPTAT